MLCLFSCLPSFVCVFLLLIPSFISVQHKWIYRFPFSSNTYNIKTTNISYCESYSFYWALHFITCASFCKVSFWDACKAGIIMDRYRSKRNSPVTWELDSWVRRWAIHEHCVACLVQSYLDELPRINKPSPPTNDSLPAPMCECLTHTLKWGIVCCLWASLIKWLSLHCVNLTLLGLLLESCRGLWVDVTHLLIPTLFQASAEFMNRSGPLLQMQEPTKLDYLD